MRPLTPLDGRKQLDDHQMINVIMRSLKILGDLFFMIGDHLESNDSRSHQDLVCLIVINSLICPSTLIKEMNHLPLCQPLKSELIGTTTRG